MIVVIVMVVVVVVVVLVLVVILLVIDVFAIMIVVHAVVSMNTTTFLPHCSLNQRGTNHLLCIWIKEISDTEAFITLSVWLYPIKCGYMVPRTYCDLFAESQNCEATRECRC
jgi:hypothetical protein